MLKITKVLNESGECLQRFFLIKSNRFSAAHANKHYIEEVILDHRLSLVASCGEGKIIKLLKARTWHEKFKLLYGKSRVHIEFNGAKKLSAAGVGTPKVYEMGIRFPWLFNSKFISYYIMEDLRCSGAFLVKEMIKSGDMDDKNVTKFGELLLKDLIKMRINKILYTDLHFGNIFYDLNKSKVYFIDTGAKTYQGNNFDIKFFNILDKFFKGAAGQLFSDKNISDMLLRIKSCPE